MPTPYPPFDAKAIPSPEVLAKAGEMEVLDAEGKKVKFGTVFEKEKAIVVFIRHFFCGSCLAYVQNLVRVPQPSLDAAGTRIVIIGCGEAQFINHYKETSGFKGDIYADPSREVFRAMGMTLENLKLNPPEEPRASYLGGQSIVANAFAGLGRAFSAPTLIGKQGNIFQLGGEFVLGPGANISPLQAWSRQLIKWLRGVGKQCSFVSRMEHTMQHASVEELMHAAGVEYTEGTFDPKAIPTAEELAKVGGLDVLDADGKGVKFGSLFEKEKAVVVFIRHFACGLCHAYVENLVRVPKESLDAAQARIIVIGCGEAQFINTTRVRNGSSSSCNIHALLCATKTETTGFTGDIYADPSRKVFRGLGMIENLKGLPSGEKAPSYLKGRGVLANTLTSIKRTFSAPSLIGKQGNISQNGGEFVLGPGNQCTFASRMEHTMQHTSVEDLMRAAGVEYKEEAA
ncbi:hypothetical protein NMY22_g18453 [Coprinellus aureogranulatus]|nr:hypothetical protein NMY22_g18453 [Coprinellus aureogranulatus]